MALTDPAVGHIVRYHRDDQPHRPLLAEIVTVPPGQAWRGGRSMITAVLLQSSPDRCFLRGHQIAGLEDDRCWSPATPAQARKARPLEPVPLWGCLRGGQLWDWYDTAGHHAWIPTDAEHALRRVGVPHGNPRLFRKQAEAAAYLRQEIAWASDGQPGDTLGLVQAKTWRHDTLTWALITDTTPTEVTTP